MDEGELTVRVSTTQSWSSRNCWDQIREGDLHNKTLTDSYRSMDLLGRKVSAEAYPLCYSYSNDSSKALRSVNRRGTFKYPFHPFYVLRLRLLPLLLPTKGRQKGIQKGKKTRLAYNYYTPPTTLPCYSYSVFRMEVLLNF